MILVKAPKHWEIVFFVATSYAIDDKCKTVWVDTRIVSKFSLL